MISTKKRREEKKKRREEKRREEKRRERREKRREREEKRERREEMTCIVSSKTLMTKVVFEPFLLFHEDALPIYGCPVGT
ncbi:hypothetical protein DUI87_10902 [Hirundo rustica rustica]|uniref:Uncharacterized protein n=1 Tax=Hirundo rustica rustica TaxID=333673 RepID=A0A3M0L247_HIRRU|nr:hypothetical protein DUI87_10902 [Hirundo rustica rustica]